MVGSSLLGPWQVPSRSRQVILFLLLFTAVCMARVRYIGTPGNDWHDAINSDGKGYYEYLRMFLFPSPQMHPGRGPVHPGIDADVIKHFSGAALAMAPFVLGAHMYTLFNPGKVEDGYSLHYQLAVGLAAWCWLGLGLLALRRFLVDIGTQDAVVAIVLVLLTLGTGLIVQVVVHPAMSHVYGFATIALLFTRVRALLIAPSLARMVACAALLGLAVLIRPVNILIVLALPLAGLNAAVDRVRLQQLFFSRAVLMAALAFAGMVSIQGLLWYLQRGSFLVNSYPDEGFHWGRPEVLRSLFSARNGLFFYWPVLLLVLPGLVSLWRRKRRAAMSFLCFAIAFMYVTSCWWNWAYGDNFGQRTYLDMLSVIAVPFAQAVPSARSSRKLIVLVGALLCTMNLFQGWQYKNHLLIPGQMDLARYRYVLLETDPQRVSRVGGFAELPLYAPRGYAPVLTSWTTTTRSVPLDGDTLRDLALAPIPASTVGHPLHLQVDLDRTELEAGASNKAWIALVLRKDGIERTALRFRMNLVPDAGSEQHTWHYAFNMRQHEAGDTLVIMGSAAHGFRVDQVRPKLTVRR